MVSVKFKSNHSVSLLKTFQWLLMACVRKFKCFLGLPSPGCLLLPPLFVLPTPSFPHLLITLQLLQPRFCPWNSQVLYQFMNLVLAVTSVWWVLHTVPHVADAYSPLGFISNPQKDFPWKWSSDYLSLPLYAHPHHISLLISSITLPRICSSFSIHLFACFLLSPQENARGRTSPALSWQRSQWRTWCLIYVCRCSESIC